MIPVFNVLNANTDVAALVADRIYKDLAPENTQYPFVTWFITGGEPFNDIDEPATVDRLHLQVDCYGKNESEAYAVYKAVRSALKYQCNISGFVNTGIPPQGSRSMSFEAVWLNDSD
ncbi:hypothetical protein F975_01765 [Acinetobacter sp. ANC 3789]|uniref:DUF3168 domain-containing protein n=1 Tax=Acinetobacter sp. ANC 3789 TaxID=1217714 RepID=UPI0002CE62BD|nr:DUF3168 domain-containing protein [Acinetobacter sp. ANC 3789]ENU80013.1 hypothetical protein F975_01765 [Acinetobacter sp. ANC 3789]